MGLEAHFQLLMGLSGPGGLTGEWAEGGFHPAKPHPDLDDGVRHTHLDESSWPTPLTAQLPRGSELEAGLGSWRFPADF